MSGDIFQIAIDGPAASGKSTTASLLAHKLGFSYIDSGAIYRALTWKVIQEGLDPEDSTNLPKILSILESIQFTYRIDESVIQVKDKDSGEFLEKKRPVFIVRMNGQDAPDAEIRTPLISQKVSRIAKVPEFRKIIVQCQRLFASQKPINSSAQNMASFGTSSRYSSGVVMDGRDIGSVVLPNADIKLFLVADPIIRAQRRLEELVRSSSSANMNRDAILDDLLKRDREDETRQASPLIQASDAILLDTSHLSVNEAVAYVTDLVLQKWPTVLSRKSN